jgi:hypothetical protein
LTAKSIKESVKMPDLYFDFGNAELKYFDGEKSFGHQRHAIYQMSESEWRNATQRAKQPPEGYIAVEGRYFAIGDKARRYVLKDKPRGADRYVQEYYGVAMAYAISEIFDNSHRVINLYASHAPRDIAYVDDIRNAALGRWHFVTYKGEYNLTVKTVDTFDEPLGGFNHTMLTKDGKLLKSNPYRQSTVLVLDVGGYTTDVVAVDPGGSIDEASLRSTLTGAIGVYETFESELRSQYRAEFKGTPDISPDRLENAIAKGFYQFGNMQLECAEIARAAVASLTNDVVDVIKAAGGVANFDVIFLTGGGSALIAHTIQKAVPTIDFVLAEPNTDLLRYANVFGGAKFFTMMKRMEALKNG